MLEGTKSLCVPQVCKVLHRITWGFLMMVYSDSVAGEEEPIQVRKKHKSAAGTYYIPHEV